MEQDKINLDESIEKRDEKYYENDAHTLEELFQRSKLFSNTSEFLYFLNFVGRISHYSHFNAMVVYLQNPKVNYFGTTGYWKKQFNRTVKENARNYIAIRPWGPIMIVYDIYDTDGKQSPDEIIKQAVGDGVFAVHGHLSNELFSDFLGILSRYNIKINTKIFIKNMAGYTENSGLNQLSIVIDERASIEEKFQCLIHELAHNFLGHLGDKELICTTTPTGKKSKKPSKISIKNRNVSKYMREVEAESVSFLICKRLGLETSSYKYLSIYLKDDMIKMIDINTIIKVADKIEQEFFSKLFEF